MQSCGELFFISIGRFLLGEKDVRKVAIFPDFGHFQGAAGRFLELQVKLKIAHHTKQTFLFVHPKFHDRAAIRSPD